MLLILAERVSMGWPDAVAFLGLCVVLSLLAWGASRGMDDGVTIWFRPPERFEPSWKGKDQGLAPGEVCPPSPAPATTTNDTTARR